MGERLSDLHSMPEAGPTTELQREALTMALYVAICLLAVLTALGERADAGHVRVLGVVWGTTIGLAAAHWFAFRLSARLVARGAVHGHDASVALAQLAGAAATASLATIPIAVLSPTAELDAVRLVLAGFISAVGYAVARSSGSSKLRAVLYAGAVLVLALVVAVVKNVLSHH